MNNEFLTKKTLQALSLREGIQYVLEHSSKVDVNNVNSLERFYENVVMRVRDSSINDVLNTRSKVTDEFRKYGITRGYDLAVTLAENKELAMVDIPGVVKISYSKKKTGTNG